MTQLTDLITPAYLALNRDLHQQPRKFGQSGRKHAAEVLAVAGLLDIADILDYGCGQGTLREAIRLQGWQGTVREYDPAVPGKDQLPSPASMVVCTDVLEHIEPECLEAVLDHLRKLTLKVAYLSISTVPSNKSLRDGRNAHLIVQPPGWWIAKIAKRWTVRSVYQRHSDKGDADVMLWLTR